MRNCITVELEINSVLHLIKYEFEIELPNTAPKRWHMLGVGRMLRGLNYSCFQAQSCFQWDRNISIGMSFRFESQQALKGTLTWTIEFNNTYAVQIHSKVFHEGLQGWCCFEGDIDATPQFRATQGSGFAQNDFLHGYTHNEHIVGSKNEHGANIRPKLIVPIRLQQKIK